ncbi:uncharacterized protein LOC135684163 [Rhopilema esculentum]|uniref:uncharacterized protein LOC135684163 n=1 Tax=Rhopilema esculentum TaxID=499914 RepID=UPI0031D2C335
MMGALSRKVQLELRSKYLKENGENELPPPPSYRDAIGQTVFTIDGFCASRDTQNVSTSSNEDVIDIQGATTDHEGQDSSVAVEVETSDQVNQRTLENRKKCSKDKSAVAVFLTFIFLLSVTCIYMGSTYLFVCPAFMPILTLYLGAYGLLVIFGIAIQNKLKHKMEKVTSCCCLFGGMLAFLVMVILSYASWGGPRPNTLEHIPSVYETKNGTLNCHQTFVDFTRGITLSLDIFCVLVFCFIFFSPCILRDD